MARFVLLSTAMSSVVSSASTTRLPNPVQFTSANLETKRAVLDIHNAKSTGRGPGKGEPHAGGKRFSTLPSLKSCTRMYSAVYFFAGLLQPLRFHTPRVQVRKRMPLLFVQFKQHIHKFTCPANEAP
ncbi:hypothetical protein QBC36DRAFT_43762 [Triangularia setosa]|uniref:Secreted protein n=1 Tax=Triangularia setosa TaxID=2587417 RepID=A0AAN6WE46_9PEZI|nr:hypothetical protein QBC36DRAFT_43762 [Podospora setosa]